MSKTETIATRISALFGDDGQVWKTGEGDDMNALLEECAQERYSADGMERHVFSDGSAILTTDGGWDVEGAGGFEWEVS